MQSKKYMIRLLSTPYQHETRPRVNSIDMLFAKHFAFQSKTACITMRFVWICVLLVCYISRSLGATVKASQNPVGIPEDENKNAVDETEQNVEISRIKNEFNNFSEMVDKFMQEYSVQNFEGLKNLTAIDIIRKVIDRNATYTVTNFPNSCPPYRTGHGIYEVKVAGLPAFEVLCNSNIAGPGWTVIASRTVGDLNFFRSWQEYKDGFGSLTTEFFIGLDKLHAITAAQPHELYIYFEDFQGNKRHALYADFLIGSESEKYVMSKLGSYSGDVGDSLKRHAIFVKVRKQRIERLS